MTEQGLVAHWPLEADHRSRTANELSSIAHGIEFVKHDGRAAAQFNGIDSRIEVADHPALRVGTGDFSIALWLHSKPGKDGGDIVGDLISKFDPEARRGMNLVVSTQSGMTTTSISNYRQLQFGIDNAREDPEWTHCGRPGQAVMVNSMAAINGALYAGTFENNPEQYGHLWRYEGDSQWTDLGAAPTKCNSVESIALFDGSLVCSTGRSQPRGSQLGPALNIRPGGPVYRVEPDGRWIDMGHPALEGAKPDDEATSYGSSDQADTTVALTVYRGNLYATSHHRRGIYRYEGDRQWKKIGPDLRIMTMVIFQDRLYALINGGGVYRYEGGSDWTSCGSPPRSTQTYSALTYQGNMYVGTWPECEVIRYNGGESWTNMGRVGFEREIMAAAVYNGKCYFGTLPMANVFRMDSSKFTFFGNIDNCSTVYLRRVWSMCIHKGQLFAGSLPQGNVMRRGTGCVATHDHELPAGWQHIAAIRRGRRLEVHVNGRLVTQSADKGAAANLDLDNNQPLCIGGGIGHVLNGALRDVRLYNRALDTGEITALSQSR